MKEEVNNIYNNFNLEVIKLFKLLLNFGLYEKTFKQNEFLSVLKYLLLILEFEKNYPEGQILLDRSRKNKEKTGKKNLFNDMLGALGTTGKMLNVFQMFGNLNTGLNQKKKKRGEKLGKHYNIN